jgi:hypothetical protein
VWLLIDIKRLRFYKETINKDNGNLKTTSFDLLRANTDYGGNVKIEPFVERTSFIKKKSLMLNRKKTEPVQ